MIAALFDISDKKVCELLSQGGVILLPSDTVWGLACDFENPHALKKLFDLKKSEPRQTALLGSDIDQFSALGIRLEGSAQRLAKKFWPGALTIVVPTDSRRFELVAAPDKTIGVRIPDFVRLRNLIRGYGKPLAASSANFTGENPPRALAEIRSSIISGVDAVIETEARAAGTASTVVKCDGDVWRYLRAGSIREADIRKAVESVGGEV